MRRSCRQRSMLWPRIANQNQIGKNIWKFPYSPMPPITPPRHNRIKFHVVLGRPLSARRERNHVGINIIMLAAYANWNICALGWRWISSVCASARNAGRIRGEGPVLSWESENRSKYFVIFALRESFTEMDSRKMVRVWFEWEFCARWLGIMCGNISVVSIIYHWALWQG